jgi:head-tail adaptor
MAKGAGKLDRPVAFDAPVRTSNEAGGSRTSWSQVFAAWAEFRFQRGGEAAQSGGLQLGASFKIRLRSTALSRALTGEHTMRDLQTGVRYNLRQIDAVSDRAHVWIVAEAGGAA